MMDERDWIRQLVMQQMMGGGMSPQIAGPGVYQDGTPKTVSVGDQGKQGNLMQDVMQILFDPSMGMMSEMLGGATGGIDYNQAFNTAGVEQEQAPMAPARATMQLDSLRMSEVGAVAAQMIEDGVGLPDVNDAIRQAGLDPDYQADMISAAQGAFKEWGEHRAANSKYEQELAQYEAKPAARSPINQQLSDAGMPTLDQQYSRDYFDPTLASQKQQNAADLRSANSSLMSSRRRQEALPLQGYMDKRAAEGDMGSSLHIPAGAEFVPNPQTRPAEVSAAPIEQQARTLTEQINAMAAAGGDTGSLEAQLWRLQQQGQAEATGMQNLDPANFTVQTPSGPNLPMAAAISQRRASNGQTDRAERVAQDRRVAAQGTAIANRQRSQVVKRMSDTNRRSAVEGHKAGLLKLMGRTPTGDAMAQRMAAARAFGFSI